MKKSLPFGFLKFLDPYKNKNLDKVEVFEKDDTIICFKDKDPNSNFIFEILAFDAVKNKYHLKWYPLNPEKMSAHTMWADIQGLNSHFDNWIKTIEKFDLAPTILDDHILIAHKQFYEDLLLFDDQNAEITPLNPSQILILDKYLENIEVSIDELRDTTNQHEIDGIKTSANQLRLELGKESRNTTMRKFSSLCGKIAKQGAPFIKKFLTKLLDKSIEKVIQIAIEKGPELIP